MPTGFSHDKQLSDGGFGHFGDCVEHSCGAVRRRAVPDPLFILLERNNKTPASRPKVLLA
jgi:hypothetical protein